MSRAVTTDNLQNVREEKQKSAVSVIRYPTYIVVTLVLMFVAVIYVGSHIHMLELEYKVAAELNINRQKMEEQKKLKLEIAMLKSPQRIENVAKNKLQMSYPEREQVIVLKISGE